jgi:hypothetical protein
MTVGGGMTQDWDAARLALGRVAVQMEANPEISLEGLRQVENYELIPEPVRDALEGLAPDERRLVTKVFTTLADNHFYLENGHGGLEFY